MTPVLQASFTHFHSSRTGIGHRNNHADVHPAGTSPDVLQTDAYVFNALLQVLAQLLLWRTDGQSRIGGGIELSFAYQCCIYLIKNTVKTVIFGN